jgi:quercetin dioxygenase-like cupin family protein
MIRTRTTFVGALLGILAAVTISVAQADADAKDGTILTALMEKPLANRSAAVAGLLTVEYAPGAGTPPHSHPADTFVYVLEGAIEMQVAGGELKTLKQGDTFYELPTDKHVVSRNASKTERAKFLVMFIKEKSAELVVPEPAAAH